MTNVTLGELCAINSHPFSTSWNSFDSGNQKKVLIGADASFIPPVMVVCEILNNTGEHDPDTGVKQVSQVRGIFYSHHSHKFEKHWFKVDEVKSVENGKLSNNAIKIKSESIQDLKRKYLNQLVILSNVDVELNKEKISQERKNFESVNLKRSPCLEFVPPIMTVIDVRVAEALKDNYHKVTGKQKRVVSKFDFKCKYYNPNSCTYSEEWIPYHCLADITSNFDLSSLTGDNVKDKFLLYPLDVEIKFEDNDKIQFQTIVRVKELVFNHYEYILKAEEIWNHKMFDINVDDPSLTNDNIEIDDLMYSRIPNKTVPYPLPPTKFKVGGLYEIEYLSDRGNSSKRLIYITETYPILEDDTLIIANCLLRNGQVRHFKVKNIKSSRRVKTEFKKLLIKSES